MQMPSRSSLTQRHRYRQVLPPLRFPVEETVTEGRAHFRLRLLLFESLDLELGSRATVCSDQFVYWNARDPRRCLAPDVFVCLGTVLDDVDTWKSWEHGGAPHLAVEISSPSDTPEGPWADKLDRYAELGVRELVRYHREAPPGRRLRIWDRVDDNLLEREVGERAEWSEVLELWWVVVPDPTVGRALRLARDPTAHGLLLTPLEQRDRQLEQERQAREQERQAREQERQARETAEQRIRELEDELRRRKG